jgi:hypothetical protein
MPPPLPTNRPAKAKSAAPPPPPVVPALTPSSVRAVRPQPDAGQTRIRVSIKTSARDAALMVVRPLPDGEKAPAGTQEAFLIVPEDLTDDAAWSGSGGQ